jgi:CRP-like cAMP-binding protein
MRRPILSPSRTAPEHNQLLASLPPEITGVLAARLEPVSLVAGDLLYEAGTVLGHVHFPVTTVVSLFSPLLDGACTEVAVVGHEGVVGVCAFMGGGKALSSAVVQRAGLAWRMGARDIADLARDHGPVMQQLLRYTQALFTHMAQSSACHRHHALEPQLCRWLLQHVDRQADTVLTITHERIAGMLGVRREGITSAALKLQRAGLISYRRGHMQVLDRRGLEARSCECYGVVQKAYERLRSDSPGWPRTAPPCPPARLPRALPPSLRHTLPHAARVAAPACTTAAGCAC